MIGAVVVYFLKVLLIQGLFFSFYWAVLRHRTDHSLNRGYLLGCVLISLVIPFIHIPEPTNVVSNSVSYIINWVEEPVGLMQPIAEISDVSGSVPMWGIISWAYVGLVAFFLVKSVFNLFILYKIRLHSQCVNKSWFKLFRTNLQTPFTFFRSVFIPQKLFGQGSFEQILAHECVHVQKRHSVDRLLMDFLVSLFWFNPFIYLYRNALIEIHEYQADEGVVSQFNDLNTYQEILYSQLQPVSASGFVSHFNLSIIKKRIVMMNKTKSSGRSRLVYALTLPVVALIFLSFTARETNDSLEEITSQIEEITGPFDLGVKSSMQEDNSIPSILPFKTTDDFKITSTFGKRKDPISGESKQHNGIDLAAPIGTEVIATADGIVQASEVVNDYGKTIRIKHGDIYTTKYTQLSEFKVAKGDRVKKGQVIGLSGNSGRSTGAHLHYEVFKEDQNVNPIEYIKNYKFHIIKEIPKKGARSEATPAPQVDRSNVGLVEVVDVDEEVDIRVRTEVEAQVAMAVEAERNAQVAAFKVKPIIAAQEVADSRISISSVSEGGILVETSAKERSPLFVVDGVKVADSEIKQLEPTDIKSINVLKGESATERYGREGENGVVEIYLSEGNSEDDSKYKVKDKSKDKQKRKMD